MRDALRMAVAQYAAAVPTLAAQGQDVEQIITRIADVIKGRQKGQLIEDIVEKAFTPAQQPQAPAMGMPGIPGAGAAPVSASQPTPVQPGGAAPAPGAPQGRPDIASLLASIGGAA